MPCVGKTKRQPMKGRPDKDGLIVCPCRFDEDTFYQIHKYRNKQGVTFAEAVRELVEFGLIDTNTD